MNSAAAHLFHFALEPGRGRSSKEEAQIASLEFIKHLPGGGPPGRIRPALPRRPSQRGFTLVEVVIALALAAIFITATVAGYIQSHRQAEWAAYSLAANSLAMQELERTRAAKWDPQAYPPVDQVVSSNFPDRVEVLDIPLNGTNIVYGTNHTTITTISVTPGLKMIRTDCRWSFPKRGLFTNSVFTYRAPDQ
ncbi:MAG: prepilin-type N-terminal cleavage/methylation domain-containing protein [Verrucomicrobia bacterium]|nr:prepilin-type N-terminal cleavage/methylation domain-containing protein [Verrucomicrobiota bacterium]